MPVMGRPVRLTVHLTDAERQALRTLAFAEGVPARLGRRARALLWLERGWRVSALAPQLGVSRWTLYQWAMAWTDKGLASVQPKGG